MTNERKDLPSASNAEADSLCPGRHRAQIGLPDVSSGDSEFGNNVHAYLKDRTVKLNTKEQDMADLVLEIEAKVLDTWTQGGTRAIEKHGREIRFWRGEKGVPQNSGQVDAFWITGDGKFALIEDTKSLWGEHAEAPENLQLRDLAVLLWLNHFDLEEVIVFINQPRVTHNPKLCVYNSDELGRSNSDGLHRSFEDMSARVRASLAPNAPRIPGEKQCKFCRAKLLCPEAQKSAIAIAELAPANEMKPKEFAPIAKALPSDRLAALLNEVKLAEMVCKALTDEAKARLKAGQDVPGWCLEEGRVNNPIVDVQTVYNRAQTLGVTSPSFLRCVSIGKEKLETEVRAVTGLKGKELDREMKSLLDGCTEAKQCEPSLKRVKMLKEAA